IFFLSGRRRHTSFSRDWSSDVCSSDLEQQHYGNRQRNYSIGTHLRGISRSHSCTTKISNMNTCVLLLPTFYKVVCSFKEVSIFQIGRASCREREYDSVVA